MLVTNEPILIRASFSLELLKTVSSQMHNTKYANPSLKVEPLLGKAPVLTQLCTLYLYSRVILIRLPVGQFFYCRITRETVYKAYASVEDKTCVAASSRPLWFPTMSRSMSR